MSSIVGFTAIDTEFTGLRAQKDDGPRWEQIVPVLSNDNQCMSLLQLLRFHGRAIPEAEEVQ